MFPAALAGVPRVEEGVNNAGDFWKGKEQVRLLGDLFAVVRNDSHVFHRGGVIGFGRGSRGLWSLP